MFDYLKHIHHKIKLVGYTRFYKATCARLMQSFMIQRKVPAQLLKNSSLKKLLFLQHVDLDKKQLLVVADRCAENSFSVLGSQLQKYQTIPWHIDVRLQQQNSQADCHFNIHTFSQNKGISFEIDTLIKKDIKVPWELARFQYAPLLAKAYQLTSKEKYIIALKNQIISWIDANPFKKGIHWINPMEVAIRAVNWVVAYHYANDALREDNFHKRFVASLWEHLIFIENRWEWYDGRTNNHYLANLIGYAYLCWFFQEMPGMKKRWQYCIQELRSECEWQIFDEGTSYEGSTHYHTFVTELFIHGFLIAQTFGETIEKRLLDKLERMLSFAEHTKEIIIGDDDGGSLLYPDLYNLKTLFSFFKTLIHQKKKELFNYPSFGLSIIKTNPWDISLRHHAYQKRQPSAHFHEDWASITLSYKSIPIIVDPGSYVYTPSVYWRNYFRSIERHNTFYPYNWHSLCTDDLFFMPLARCRIQENDALMSTMHELFDYPVSRTIEVTSQCIMLQDDISHATDTMIWHFMFSSTIELKFNGTNTWDIFFDKKRLMHLESPDIVFEKSESWVSPSYGVKQKTFALVGTQKNTVPVITIRFKT